MWAMVIHAGTGQRVACRRPGFFRLEDVGHRLAGGENDELTSEHHEVGERRHGNRDHRAHTEVDEHESETQLHGRATISTGGAAKWVRVPPIETFTNSSPRVAYLRRGLGSRS